MSLNHEKFEKNIFRMGIWIAIVVSFGGLAQIVPLMFQAQVVEPLPEMKPITTLTVDFDKQKNALKSVKATMQSTLILYKGGKEVDRSTGETRKEKIVAFLKQVL